MQTKIQWKVLTFSLCIALTLLAGAGCKHKTDIEPLDFDSTNSGGTGFEETTGDGMSGVDQDSLIFNMFDPNSPDRLMTVYFDYDSFSLRPDALSILKDNADKLMRAPSLVVQVAGHCDERGTSEYNFALGEKRALAVREHLIRLGVSGDRIVTISYGEESPAVPGSNEAAWSMNRRCEFLKATAL